MSTLPRKFYSQDTVTVAKKLLGKRITNKIGRTKVSGIIVETEAYGYHNDPASHAFRKITNRNKAMFGKVGFSYVYLTYGMHYCFNVVARNPKDEAGAVLIRSIKADQGIKTMLKNRKITDLNNLANGPGKFTQAFGINMEYNGADLTSSSLSISEGIKSKNITASSRIGIKKATENLWNFKIN